ncbi:MAG: MFS transporter [Gammaproteobacteria bacterium]
MTPLEDNEQPRTWLLFGLIVAQCLGSFGQITIATLAGIVGSILAPTPGLATLAVTTGILGVALAAWPFASLRRRFGNRAIFAASLVWAAGGAVVAAAAIASESFPAFCLGTFMIGNNMAVIAQYRFAAVELVPQRMASRAISGVMVGTLLAAIIAPWIALEFRHLLAADFAGSFIALVPACLAGAILVAALPLRDVRAGEPGQHDGPPLGDILRRRPIQLAIVAASAGYGIMSLLMTATPISMHVIGEHSAEATAGVIRAHILAMFAPSLVSGWLIEKLGIPRMLWSGIALLLLCVGIAASGTELWHYRAALIALGVGWNFLFVAGTTLLTVESNKEEAARIQGFNDTVMFCTMGIASLSAGGLLYQIGWQWTNVASVVLVLLIVGALARSPRRQDRAATR